MIVGCSNISQNIYNFSAVRSQSKIDYIETDQPFGSFENPVRCDGPSGERRYLNRLKDSEGNPFSFKRIGSYGIGPYGHILDKYLIRSRINNKEYYVFMDMYYTDYIEEKAVYDLNIELDYYSQITNGLSDSISFNDLRFAWEATEDFDPHYNIDCNEIIDFILFQEFKKAQKLIQKLLPKYPLSPDLIYYDLMCKSDLGLPSEIEKQKLDQLHLSILNGCDGNSIETAITVISFAELSFILYSVNNYDVLEEKLIINSDYILKLRVKDVDDMTEKDIFFNANYLFRARNVPLNRNIRPAFALKNPFSENDNYDNVISEQPYIAGNQLQLYPGDNLLLEFNLKDGNLTNYSVVSSIAHAEKTVKIEFSLHENGNRRFTELVIHNPFDKKLKYKAELLKYNLRDYQPVDISPTDPGSKSNEIWSSPIASLILSEFKLE